MDLERWDTPIDIDLINQSINQSNGNWFNWCPLPLPQRSAVLVYTFEKYPSAVWGNPPRSNPSPSPLSSSLDRWAPLKLFPAFWNTLVSEEPGPAGPEGPGLGEQQWREGQASQQTMSSIESVDQEPESPRAPLQRPQHALCDGLWVGWPDGQRRQKRDHLVLVVVKSYRRLQLR